MHLRAQEEAVRARGCCECKSLRKRAQSMLLLRATLSRYLSFRFVMSGTESFVLTQSVFVPEFCTDTWRVLYQRFVLTQSVVVPGTCEAPARGLRAPLLSYSALCRYRLLSTHVRNQVTNENIFLNYCLFGIRVPDLYNQHVLFSNDGAEASAKAKVDADSLLELNSRCGGQRQRQRHTDTQTHRNTDTQKHRHSDTQTHRHTDTQTHRHTDTQCALSPHLFHNAHGVPRTQVCSREAVPPHRGRNVAGLRMPRIPSALHVQGIPYSQTRAPQPANPKP
eukprot:2200903-Rhodomonas_salina.2